MELIKVISCPITKRIFHTPALASDNNVYEAEILFNLIEKELPSPISGKLLEEDIKVPINLKSFIDLVVSKNNNLEKFRYESSFDIKKVYKFSKSQILTIFMERSNYENLLNYNKFKISDIDKNSFLDFLRFGQSNIIIHFIDNCSDLDYKYEESSWNILNYICKYCNSRVVKHVINTYPNFDYNNESSSGWRPIHQIAAYHDYESVMLLLDKSVDLFAKTSECISGLEYIVTNQNKECIMKTIGIVDYLKNGVTLPILMIRLDDNEHISESDRDELKCFFVSKYN